jgi:hypothetical protein
MVEKHFSIIIAPEQNRGGPNASKVF